MKPIRYLAVVSAVFVPFVLAALANGCSGCKKDETEPVPSAAPPPAPAPVATLAPEEDAGLAVLDAGDASDAKKVGTGGGDPTGIRKCCQALRQNAKSAPPEQQGILTTAAGLCDGMVNNPQGRQALSQVRGILRGANIPVECQ